MHLDRDGGDLASQTLHSQQFELLVKSISDYAIFILDPGGIVRTWNPGAERLKGYREHEIVGRPSRVFYTPEDLAAGRPERLLETARREGHVEDEGWRVRQDGRRFWANVVITAIRDEQGVLAGFGKVTRDLTERRGAEQAIAERNERLMALNEELAAQQEELAAQADELREADRLKDQFLSILSHELRTPLSAVLGFASILDDEVAGALTPRQHAYMGKILAGTEMLLALINDLLDMSRIQAGKFRLEPEPLSLGGPIREALSTVSALVEQKGLRLSSDVPDGLPVVEGDPQRLSQVVLNLVGNAIKFTPRGGAVAVRACAADGGVRVEVSDTGPGIAAELRARLFEPFFQADGASTRPAAGTGLGLAIARALVEAHGGVIDVDSTPGVGSTFWFELPAAQGGAQSHAPPGSAAPPGPARS